MLVSVSESIQHKIWSNMQQQQRNGNHFERKICETSQIITIIDACNAHWLRGTLNMYFSISRITIKGCYISFSPRNPWQNTVTHLSSTTSIRNWWTMKLKSGMRKPEHELFVLGENMKCLDKNPNKLRSWEEVTFFKLVNLNKQFCLLA